MLCAGGYPVCTAEGTIAVRGGGTRVVAGLQGEVVLKGGHFHCPCHCLFPPSFSSSCSTSRGSPGTEVACGTTRTTENKDNATACMPRGKCTHGAQHSHKDQCHVEVILLRQYCKHYDNKGIQRLQRACYQESHTSIYTLHYQQHNISIGHGTCSMLLAKEGHSLRWGYLVLVDVFEEGVLERLGC